MINYVVGDLFSSPAQALVNTVNTVGVMGKGIALTFRRVFPEMFEEYRVLCETDQLSIGELFLYKNPHKWILNFPTKKHWRGKSKLEYIDLGLEKFASAYNDEGIESISFPMLGCQHGGLDWDDVRPVMERHLKSISKEITVYIHLYRPDLLPFPDHRDHRILKSQLTGKLDYPVFEDFWLDVQPHFSKKHAETLWDLIKDGQYVRLDALPESIQPINYAGGCVYVRQVKGDKFLIGHRSDRKKLSRANLVEEIPAINWESVEQELGTMFAVHKVLGSRKQFILNKAQIAEIKIFANQQRYKLVAETLHNVPSIRCVLLSNDPQPTCQDIGLQLLPNQVKSRPTQRKLTL